MAPGENVEQGDDVADDGGYYRPFAGHPDAVEEGLPQPVELKVVQVGRILFQLGAQRSERGAPDALLSVGEGAGKLELALANSDGNGDDVVRFIVLRALQDRGMPFLHDLRPLPFDNAASLWHLLIVLFGHGR